LSSSNTAGLPWPYAQVLFESIRTSLELEEQSHQI
jgi:hypothetical protein